jgi:hypothetical protein
MEHDGSYYTSMIGTWSASKGYGATIIPEGILPGPIFSLLKLNDDEILVGGSFKTASGSLSQNLAVYEAASNSLRPLTSSAYNPVSQAKSIGVDQTVYHLECFSPGPGQTPCTEVLIAGSFENGVVNSIPDSKQTVAQANVGGLISATFKIGASGAYDACTLARALPGAFTAQKLRVVGSAGKTVFYGGDFSLPGTKAVDIAQFTMSTFPTGAHPTAGIHPSTVLILYSY